MTLETRLQSSRGFKEHCSRIPNCICSNYVHDFAVFLLGVTLIIYGLRLTLRAPKRTSRYFKAMMCALLSPVIVIVLAYELGITFGAPLEIYNIAEPLLIISLLLWIPTGIIIFLLVADRKLMQHLETKL